MSAELKPPTRPIWAEAGDITAPANSKKSLGWVVEVPPFEYFNWVLNNLSAFAAHVNESGIPEWDFITSYDIDAYTKGSNGTIYQSKANSNVGNDPSTVQGEQFWKPAFISKFSEQSNVAISGFTPADINDLTLLLNNASGPFYLTQGTFTASQLTTIRNDLISAWVSEVEAP